MRFGPAAQDHDLVARRLALLALVLPGGVVVGRLGRELGGAGVDQLVDRCEPHLRAQRRHRVGRAAGGGGDLAVGVAELLRLRQQLARERRAAQLGLEVDQPRACFSRNQRSMRVASWISSRLQPVRKARWMAVMRRSFGTRRSCEISSRGASTAAISSECPARAPASPSRARAAPSAATLERAPRCSSPRRRSSSASSAPGRRPGTSRRRSAGSSSRSSHRRLEAGRVSLVMSFWISSRV